MAPVPTLEPNKKKILDKDIILFYKTLLFFDHFDHLKNIRWDHFEILATGRSDNHCKINETLLTKDLKPALNENVGSEKLFLY